MLESQVCPNQSLRTQGISSKSHQVVIPTRLSPEAHRSKTGVSGLEEVSGLLPPESPVSGQKSPDSSSRSQSGDTYWHHSGGRPELHRNLWC